ncbi:MAG: carboxymuconolactone decarboxylase family protein [Alphaproteobacteria bacterium]|jgi:4-carboxymuconolactone decarboxylase
MAASKSRLSPMSLEDLTPEQRAVYKSINSPPRASMGFNGPYAAYVKAPAIGGLNEKLGAIIRFDTACPEHFKKIASCIVGQHHQAKFEFAAQTPFAREAGLSESVIESLRLGETPAFDSTDEKIIYDFCHQFVHTRRASDELYDRARDLLGETQLVELVATIAYYTTVCITLNAFDVPLAEGMKDPFPN